MLSNILDAKKRWLGSVGVSFNPIQEECVQELLHNHQPTVAQPKHEQEKTKIITTPVAGQKVICKKKDAFQAQTNTHEKEDTPKVTAQEPSHHPIASHPYSQGIPQWKQDSEKALANVHHLSQLREAMEQYTHCSLKNTARHLVFARGQATSSLFIIGEAPGQEEDAKGLPFVGRSGRLLDAILDAANISNPYISNIVPWRPPGNRDPSPLEIEQCRPFLQKHIMLVKPKILLLLGRVAAQELLNVDSPIGSLRGKWHKISVDSFFCHALVTYHPSYGLRNPKGKRMIWNDILMLHDRLQE